MAPTVPKKAIGPTRAAQAGAVSKNIANERALSIFVLGEWVEIEVSDTGCGMDADVRRRLFQGIFSTKAAAGTGIGLMMTKRIVDQHQGRIGVDSRAGEGATFTIRLPQAPPGRPGQVRPERRPGTP